MNQLVNVIVENVKGTLVTTSNRVAEELGVQHKHLLEKIDVYVSKFSSAETSAQFYIQSEYKTQDGRTVRNFLITKKGIAQIIGGYSARVEKAFELNVAYINEFERMEEQLKQIVQPKLPTTYLEALKELVKAEEEKLLLSDKVKRLTHSKKLYTSTELAKELGFKSAIQFNRILEENKIQYKCNSTWVLYSEYAEKDYVSIKQTELDNGKIIYDRRWTGLGRDFLIEFFKK